MRPLLAALVLASAAPTAFADTPLALSPKDVTAALSSRHSTIQHCYLDHTHGVAGAGALSIELNVSRKGELGTVAIQTPGLDTAVGVRVGGCIVDTLTGVTFPARRARTTVTVPYYFQRTAAADAGPYESCWKAEGCRSEPTIAKVAPVPAKAAPAKVAARAARHGATRSRQATR